MTQSNKKSKRGGRREGAGRKALLIDAVVCKVYLDKETKEFMKSLDADSNLSAGIREAAKVIKYKLQTGVINAK